MKVNDIDVPTSVKVNDNELQLNGAGTRKVFGMDIYVGALYAKEKSNDTANLLNSTNPIKFTVFYLYGPINKARLISAWKDGFKKNASEENVESMSDEFEAFYNTFEDAHKGDVVEMDLLPSEGINFYKNGIKTAFIESSRLQNNILNVLLGSSPVDEKLKNSLLGA